MIAPNWRPSATFANLQQRAVIIQKIRDFFRDRGVLEVDTPLLYSTTVLDPHIASFYTQTNHYLQTSPEFAMKRLLAAYPIAIYQICKAFRLAERGQKHNPEFTMLEWYRPGFDHHQLMDEVDELLRVVLNTAPAKKYTFAALLQEQLGFDPHTCDLATLQNCAEQNGLHVATNFSDATRDTWLDFIMSHLVEPELGKSEPIFIYDYPASQAALAKIRNDNPPVAERFEVYWQGIELANGYHELNDAAEQRRRFQIARAEREALGHESPPMDERLLAALEHMPNCAGVALGIDRLIMLSLQCNSIDEAISFTWDRL